MDSTIELQKLITVVVPTNGYCVQPQQHCLDVGDANIADVVVELYGVSQALSVDDPMHVRIQTAIDIGGTPIQDLSAGSKTIWTDSARVVMDSASQRIYTVRTPFNPVAGPPAFEPLRRYVRWALDSFVDFECILTFRVLVTLRKQ